MASVLVQIDGIIWDDAEKAGKKVTIYGQMFRPDLGIGGGPIYPPDKPKPPDWGIWPGPGDPDFPGGGKPPGGGGGEPPNKPPPITIGDGDWKLHAVWIPSIGWVPVIVPVGDQPIPGPSK